MSEDSHSGDWDRLIEFLREQRDKYEQMAADGRESEDMFQKAYGTARYHAYAEVLAWLYGEGYVERGGTTDN